MQPFQNRRGDYRAAVGHEAEPRLRQGGFMMMDIMSAAVVLSIFMAGIGAYWKQHA